MAAAYVTIKCKRGEIRKFGGNRNDVRSMRDKYKNMSEEEFISKHPYLTTDDYKSLETCFTRKNR